MRRKDREQSKEFGFDVIDGCQYGTAAMIDLDGSPYAVMLSLVRSGEKLYFHSAMEGKKTDILRKNPTVCVTFAKGVQPVEDKFTTLYESAVVFGRAEEVTEDSEKIEALRLLCQKLTPQNMADFDNAINRSLGRTAVWCISIDNITAKCKS